MKKVIKFTDLSKILIFSFQRINWNTKTKNNSKIFFDINLDMFDFVDKECMNNCINTKYQLYAILNHSGNLDEGHFYSFIKDSQNEKWLEFNDGYIKKINLELYSLFYMKKN